MFETQRNKSGTYVIVAAALCFAGGYALATYRAKNADVQVSVGANNETLLSYKNTPPRILKSQNGVVTTGTLHERLDDLLNEEPQKIRQLTKDSLYK